MWKHNKLEKHLQIAIGPRNFHKKLLPRLAEKIHVYKTEVHAATKNYEFLGE